MAVATVHPMTRDGTDPHLVLDQTRSILQKLYHIIHATVQVEPDTHQGCSEVTW
jgi:cobalt-zinc-cadmium efflux system protein